MMSETALIGQKELGTSTINPELLKQELEREKRRPGKTDRKMIGKVL